MSELITRVESHEKCWNSGWEIIFLGDPSMDDITLLLCVGKGQAGWSITDIGRCRKRNPLPILPEESEEEIPIL
jgi:hypothetical protein